MDIASDELSRICSRNNRFECLATPLTYENYYFVDRPTASKRSHESDGGETPLHRLVALHAPPHAVQTFLQHLQAHHNMVSKGQSASSTSSSSSLSSRYSELPDPPVLLAQNHLGATALHVAVHRNSWHVEQIVKTLLTSCPRLAAIPMRTGTYPLHVATGHSLTINPQVIDALVQADPWVCWKEDIKGDTPLSLLWKNVLRFRWAQQWELSGIVPECIDCSLSTSATTSVDTSCLDPNKKKQKRSSFWMTVIAPDQFRDMALTMVQPWKGGPITWHTICRAPRFPPLLLRLLLEPSQRKYVPHGSFWDVDELGRLPLHCAAGAPAVSLDLLPLELGTARLLQRNDSADETTNSNGGSIVSVLRLTLQVAPGAASIMDDTGSLPLHYALRRQSAIPSGSDIVALIRAYPDSLSVQDPITYLYPAQQLASRLKTTTTTNNHTSSDISALNLLYSMIRLEPDVLSFHL